MTTKMTRGARLNAKLRAPVAPPADASPALRARLGTGLTQTEFAERYCIDVQDLRAWEAGELSDGASTYLRLVEQFPVEIGKLVALWRVVHSGGRTFEEVCPDMTEDEHDNP